MPAFRSREHCTITQASKYVICTVVKKWLGAVDVSTNSF